MLVNSQQFPGPALWQGIMLIAVAIWAVFMFRGYPFRPSNDYLRQRKIRDITAFLVVVIIGVVIFIVL
jgi:hypothetical protein